MCGGDVVMVWCGGGGVAMVVVVWYGGGVVMVWCGGGGVALVV